MLSSPSQPVHAVHANRQRLLFFEPEPDYFMHAVSWMIPCLFLLRFLTGNQAVDLPRFSTKPTTSISKPSSKGADNDYTNYAYSDEGVEDDCLLGGLRRGYEEFRVRLFILIIGIIAS
jgi:hypothetical protein